MKNALAATLFAVASIPLLGQMPSNNPAQQPGNAPMQQNSPTTEPSPGVTSRTPASQTQTPADSQPTHSANSPQTAAATAPIADMRPVDGTLVTRLDSKTAKTGDNVVVQTESSVKTSDGTEIPKGSKVIGQVVAVHASGGQTSQLVLRFDRAELKDGKTMPIHSEIEAVGGTLADLSANATGAPETSASAAGVTSGDASPTGNAAASPGGTQGRKGPPPAGTIISKNGNIAIRTTSIPGVMLANNAPGQQDPRMAQASGLIMGANKDVELDTGTKVVLNIAAAASATP